MTTWLLDVTVGHDPQWVPIGLLPDGSVGAIVTSAAMRLPVGERPEGTVYGIWHQEGQAFLDEWLASDDAAVWREFLGC